MITILFFISFIAIAGLLGLKVFELKMGKTHFLSDVYAKGDEKIHEWIDDAIKAYARYEKIVHIFIFEFLPAYAYELLHRAKDFVARKYYEMGVDFRGKRVLKTTGSVSFFLERLSEHKKQ